MAKTCPKCGNSVSDDTKFCTACGAELEGGSTEGTPTPAAPVSNGGGAIQQRGIVMCIVLTFVTCGIYGLYWLYAMTEDANKVSGEANPTSGGMVLLLSLVTCGLYSIYWVYKMGKTLNEAGTKRGVEIQDNSVLYLILTLIGLGIVDYCLIQNDLNKLAN